MAAGLGFKTFTTGEVLTAADTNGYLMQGVLVFASAAARDAAITSPQEGQCCYLKDTDAVLTYSGAAWVGFDDSNAVQNSIVDAKGDIIAASANDTPARLAVGANDLLVTAASGEATGLKYTGGWTTWTPTFTNFTIGNGTTTARYQKIGKTVNYYLEVTLGSTSSVTGTIIYTYPIAPSTVRQAGQGNLSMVDSGTSGYIGALGGWSATQGFLVALGTGAAYATENAVNATVPFTWTTNDFFFLSGTYEVA